MRLIAFHSMMIIAACLSPATAADAPSWPANACIYRDLHYTGGTVVCVAPHFGQICNKDGGWDPPTNAAPIQEACASAQIPTNPAPSTPPPTAMCTYHGVQYSVGSTICVAPSLAQRCTPANGTEGRSGKEVYWTFVQDLPGTSVHGSKESDLSFEWCANAQIPNPAAPPPSSGK